MLLERVSKRSFGFFPHLFLVAEIGLREREAPAIGRGFPELGTCEA
jgi:hypothetical protein